MANMEVHYSSKTDLWNTPLNFFDPLNDIWKFTLDSACLEETALCKNYYTPETDGLSSSWKGETVWCNPPYSDIRSWVNKANTEFLENNVKTVMLIPSRTDTKAFHSIPDIYTLYIKGRLKFRSENHPKPTTAPFPSMLLIYDNNLSIEKINYLKSIGKLMREV